MKITPLFKQLHSGENISRKLSLEIDAEYADKNIRLGFITPLGNSYVTENLVVSNLKAEYLLPSLLLDGKGILYAQIIVFNNEEYVCKSKVYEFSVYYSVDDTSSPAAEGDDLKSIALIFEELGNKAEILHAHDDRYYTKSETDAFLSHKPDASSLSTVAFTGEYSDISNRPVISEPPSEISAFENDVGYITGESFYNAEVINSLSLGRKAGTLKSTGSAALGKGLIAENNNQLVTGKYNKADEAGEYAYIIGNGAADVARSNAGGIKWNGDGWFAGVLKTGGSGFDDIGAKELSTKEYVDGALAEKQDALTIDSAVVEGSSNPVSSDAVYTALQSVELPDESVLSVNGKTGDVMLNAADVGALPSSTPIPALPENVSAFNNDAGYLTEHQSLADYALSGHTHTLAQISDYSPEAVVTAGSINLIEKTVAAPDKDAWELYQAVVNGKIVIYDAVAAVGPSDETVAHFYFTASYATELFSLPYIIFTGFIPSNGAPAEISGDMLVRFVVTYQDGEGGVATNAVTELEFLDMGGVLTDISAINTSLASKEAKNFVINAEVAVDASDNFSCVSAVAETPSAASESLFEQIANAYTAGKKIYMKAKLPANLVGAGNNQYIILDMFQINPSSFAAFSAHSELNGIENLFYAFYYDTGEWSVFAVPIPTKGYVDGALAEKVDKVTGKGLSANDFTTAYKNKLDAFTIQTSSSAPAAGTADTIITIVT